MTFNANKVNLPKLVYIKLKDKFKIRHMMKKELLLFHIMLQQGIYLVHIDFQHSKTVQDNTDTFSDGFCSDSIVSFPIQIFPVPISRRHQRC